MLDIHIHHHVHHHEGHDPVVREAVLLLLGKVDHLLMDSASELSTLEEMSTFLDNIAGDVAKLQAEVAALGDTVPPSVADAIAALHDRMSAVKDAEPDA